MRRALLAATAAVLVAPAGAGAFTPVISAYAWLDRGPVRVDCRTDRPLAPEKIGYPQVDTSFTRGPVIVSRALNCYEGELGTARVGDRVRVRIGKHGQILDRRFTVVHRRPGYERGGLIGCTQDPKASSLLVNMYPSPSVEPVRYFFTANSGPYLDRLHWRGWGTRRATATATYISDCASCGPKLVRRSVVVVHRIACAAWGGYAYVGTATAYTSSGDPRRVPIGDSNYCT